MTRNLQEAPARYAGCTFEIELYGKWLEVTWYVFRSWAGKRLIDGKTYHGPVFYLGTTHKVTATRRQA